MQSAFVHVVCENRMLTISSGLLGSVKMRRDMEVVRKILRAVQDKPDLTPRLLKVEGLDDFTAGYHIAMLHKAGYIEGPSTLTNSVPYTQVLVKDLTWQGHEFAGAILTDDSTWEKIKKEIGPEKLVTLPLKVIEAVATKAVTAWAIGKIGLSG